MYFISQEHFGYLLFVFRRCAVSMPVSFHVSPGYCVFMFFSVYSLGLSSSSSQLFSFGTGAILNKCFICAIWDRMARGAGFVWNKLFYLCGPGLLGSGSRFFVWNELFHWCSLGPLGSDSRFFVWNEYCQYSVCAVRDHMAPGAGFCLERKVLYQQSGTACFWEPNVWKKLFCMYNPGTHGSGNLFCLE